MADWAAGGMTPAPPDAKIVFRPEFIDPGRQRKVIPIHARVDEARTLADDLGNFLSTADLSSLDAWDRFVAERLIERFNERTWSPCRG
jgi:hypothetical protein